MANFDVHRQDAVWYGGFVALLAFSAVIWSGASLEKATAAVAIVGAAILVVVAPDLDHPESKPRNAVVNVGTILTLGGVAYLVATDPGTVERIIDVIADLSNGHPSIGAGVLVVGALVLIKNLVGLGVDTITGSHRTWTHDRSTGLLYGGLAALVWYFLGPRLLPYDRVVNAAAVGAVILLAHFVHLARDGELI